MYCGLFTRLNKAVRIYIAVKLTSLIRTQTFVTLGMTQRNQIDHKTQQNGGLRMTVRAP